MASLIQLLSHWRRPIQNGMNLTPTAAWIAWLLSPRHSVPGQLHTLHHRAANQPDPLHLHFSPAVVHGSQITTLVLRLTEPAPVGGLAVTLTSRPALPALPPQVTVQAGERDFSMDLSLPPAPRTPLIAVTATCNGGFSRAVFCINIGAPVGGVAWS